MSDNSKNEVTGSQSSLKTKSKSSLFIQNLFEDIPLPEDHTQAITYSKIQCLNCE